MKVIISLVLMLGLAPSAYALGDVGEGKKKSLVCAGCHGVNGVADIKEYPNLAGQNAPYIASQLKAFRSGSRDNAIMTPMAKNLTDKEIDDLASFFSSL